MSFQKSTTREYFESIVIAVILALFVRTWVVQAFKIPTGSMEQNLLIGDHLLVNKFVYAPAATAVERMLSRSSGGRFCAFHDFCCRGFSPFSFSNHCLASRAVPVLPAFLIAVSSVAI